MPSAFSVDSCATRPSATIARNLGIKASDDERNWRQVLISAGNGLFCGGPPTPRRAHPATHRVADPAIDQQHPIVRAGLVDALGEAVLDQGRVKQVACEIAGEWTPRAIRALQPRRETNDQKPTVEITEGGYG